MPRGARGSISSPPRSKAKSGWTCRIIAGAGYWRALGQLAREHPQVTVNVVARGSAELSARVAAGELDLALISAGSDDTDSRIEHIVATERMVWAGLPDSRAAHRRPLPLALANHGCAWRSSVLAALGCLRAAFDADQRN